MVMVPEDGLGDDGLLEYAARIGACRAQPVAPQGDGDPDRHPRGDLEFILQPSGRGYPPGLEELAGWTQPSSSSSNCSAWMLAPREASTAPVASFLTPARWARTVRNGRALGCKA